MSTQTHITFSTIPGITVWHGDTAGGTRQVVVTLATDDAEGQGLAKAVVDIDADTTLERVAQIAHEQALGLLAHELLEGLTVAGEHAFNSHPNEALHCIPDHPTSIAAFRRIRKALGLARTIPVSVVVPADHSHTGEDLRREKPIDCGVAEIVRRLNHPVFGNEPITTGCCDGHGESPPHILMVTGECWSGEHTAIGATRSGHSESPSVVALARAAHGRERSMHLSLFPWAGLSEQQQADKAEGANMVLDLVTKALTSASLLESHQVHTAVAEFTHSPMFAGILDRIES